MKELAAKVAGLVEKAAQRSQQQLPPVLTGNFWRYPFVSLADFEKSAECGDLLLFRGTGGRCQLIRTVTRGIYDHVAMILRTQNDQLLILEATGTDGVSLIPWKNFKGWGWHRCYERLAFRKIYFERNAVQT